MSSSTRRPSDRARDEFVKSTVTVQPSAEPLDPALERLEADALWGMASAWHDGLRMPAEKWLESHPELTAHPQLAVRIIYEEVCLREEAGEVVDSTEIYRRFPEWQSALELLLDCHRVMQPEVAATNFPKSGQRLGEFQLLSELGRGGIGRVFLATQPALSDRPLVVKLTPRTTDEHLSLARLQHTHIAPLYLVQDFPQENLRALCMPFLGGDSWAHLLDDLDSTSPHQRSGRQIVELLEAARRDAPEAPHFTGPALRFLGRASYVQAVCWIGSCLADALHYAHQRGLVHLDIKPSNVLIAGDGQPMLLDFHLARDMAPAGSGPLERLGGTRGYMSPEQAAATVAVREARPLALALDGRSDVYSLGALLYESLCGQLPPADEAASRRQLRRANPQATRGIEDMLHKCLARDPEARYRDAAELAADLRRHLADLPLWGVPNHSLTERWQKWRRRRPHAFALLGALLLAVAVLAAGAQLLYGERLREAHTALAQGRQHLEGREYEAAIERFETGWGAIRWFPGQFDLKRALQTQLMQAKRSRLAVALHELVERLRFVDSFETMPVAKLHALDAGCARIWRARAEIAATEASASNTQIARQVRADLLDLALLWAELRVRLAGDEGAQAARRDALDILDEAQALCGSSGVLALAHRQYAAAPASAGESTSLAGDATAVAPKTAWEHFALGRFLFREGQWDAAQLHFRQAIEVQPDAFWPHFYLTLCAYRLERFDQALNWASVCVALAPRSAECFYNRALAHQALGHDDEALHDFAQAIELDPMLAVAPLHRGILLGEMGRRAEASADLRSALTRGADPATVYYQLARVQLAEEDRAAALQSVDEALRHNATFAPAVELKRRLDTAR